MTTGKSSWKETANFPIDNELQEAIHQKHKSHRRWMSAKKLSNDDAAHKEYAKMRKKVKTMIRQAKRRHERNIANNSKTNTKAYWSYVRKNLKTKIGVAPLLENVDDISSIKFDNVDKANILQKQFSGVYTDESVGHLSCTEKVTKESIDNLIIIKEMVHKES